MATSNTKSSAPSNATKLEPTDPDVTRIRKRYNWKFFLSVVLWILPFVLPLAAALGFVTATTVLWVLPLILLVVGLRWAWLDYRRRRKVTGTAHFKFLRPALIAVLLWVVLGVPVVISALNSKFGGEVTAYEAMGYFLNSGRSHVAGQADTFLAPFVISLLGCLAYYGLFISVRSAQQRPTVRVSKGMNRWQRSRTRVWAAALWLCSWWPVLIVVAAIGFTLLTGVSANSMTFSA